MVSKVMDFYLVTDCPKDQEYLDILCTSFRETIQAVSNCDGDVQLRAHLLFCRKTPVLYSDVRPGDQILSPQGEARCHFGGALQLLRKHLSENDASSGYCPVIAFSSNRFPDDDIVEELYLLRQSSLYQEATIIGMTSDENSPAKMLMKLLCKYDEAIITGKNLGLFPRLFRIKEKERKTVPVAVDLTDPGDISALTGDLPEQDFLSAEEEMW